MIERDQFNFNGVELSRWMRCNPHRYFTPPVDAKAIEVPGKAGAIHARTQLKPLTIPVDVRLTLKASDDVALIRRQISGALVACKPCRLFLPDEPGIYYMAELTSADELDNLWHTGGCTLEFTAYDPIAYGSERTVSLKNGNNEFEVHGTWETWPYFDLASDGGAVRIENVDTGEYVLFALSATRDAKVSADMEAAEFLVNLQLASIIPGSYPFTLAPGTVRIKLTNATGRVTYQERWV